MATQSSLTIVGYNVRSLSGNKFYINSLLERYETDILCLSEHRLYGNELYKLNDINTQYEAYGKASDDLDTCNQNIKPGHCGIALLWKRSLSHRIRRVECESDRICVIEVIGACFQRSLFIVGVYLPHQTCKISNFEYHVNVLSDVIAQCSISGEVMIIGDTNCHFGFEVGNRYWGNTTKNAKALLNVIKAHGLKVLDANEDLCCGPQYTFNIDNVGKSYIDHSIASELVVLNIINCEVIEEDIANVSDHLPIIVQMKLNSVLQRNVENAENIKSKVAWHKLSKDEIHNMYTEPLDDALSQVEQYMESLLSSGIANNDVCIEVENVLQTLVECMINQGNVLPQAKFQRHLKPYWTPELTKLSKNNKATLKKWRHMGCPRQGEMYIEYKTCKKVFRNAQREAEMAYELENMKELTKCQDIDQRYFWQLVNRHKKSKGVLTPLKLPNGKVITDANDIRNAWKDYFNRLYTPTEDPSYDSDFKLYVEDCLKVMEKESVLSNENLLENPITDDELNKIMNTLRNKKAPGWDCVSSEHVKYGGCRLRTCIKYLFQIIVKYEIVPVHFKLGIIVPIPKGTKCQTNQDNYRGITLLPVIAKMFEKWVMIRVEKWSIDNNIIHKMQGAAQAKCSSLNTSWLVREIISYNLERSKPVYVVLLDVRKAFDTVWQDGLFFKLYNYGLSGKTWRILRKLFENFKCCVQVAGQLSESFEAEQGIHQGAPLSMFMYETSGNELLYDLNNCIFGANIENVKVASPAFADDVTLAAVSKEGIQQLVSIAYKYSKKWRFSYNQSKCKAILFGKNIEKNVKIMLGDICIKVVDYEQHLGTILSYKEVCENDYIQERIKSCKSICFATQSLGSYRTPVTPVTSSKLYWQVCIPKLCYGVEVMNISENSKESLENFHNTMAKHQQGLPNHCSNVGSRGTIGWKMLDTHIDILRLLFMWRLFLLPCKCIYKCIILKRFETMVDSHVQHKGPTWRYIQTCRKYGILNLVIDAVRSGSYMTIEQWKGLIKNKLNELDLKRWHIMCRTYKSLSMLNYKIEAYQISSWWLHCFRDPYFSRQNRCIVRLLLNTKRRGRTKCMLCSTNLNTVDHVLFECPNVADVRKHWWQLFEDRCPPEFVLSVNSMSSKERCKFLLNGFNVYYNHEWKDIYDYVSHFICNVDSKYDALCPT